MTQAVYSSAQVAKMLGVSGGMVRRYAIALEELTGEEIPQHPRDGRRFNQAHVDALVSARRFVASRQGMSVETGLRLALGLAELPAATLLPTVTDVSGAVGAEALKAALGEHIGSLLTQLQTLAEEVAARHQGNHAELVEVLQEAVTELRNPNAALLFAALSEAVTRPLVAELRELRAEVVELRQGDTEPPALSDEVVGMLRALQGDLRKAQRDHAEVQEMRAEITELRAAVQAKALPPGATDARIDRALEVELQQQAPPAAHQEDDDPVECPSDGTGAGDGPVVRAVLRAARWLESRLGRGRRE